MQMSAIRSMSRQFICLARGVTCSSTEIPASGLPGVLIGLSLVSFIGQRRCPSGPIFMIPHSTVSFSLFFYRIFSRGYLAKTVGGIPNQQVSSWRGCRQRPQGRKVRALLCGANEVICKNSPGRCRTPLRVKAGGASRGQCPRTAVSTGSEAGCLKGPEHAFHGVGLCAKLLISPG